MKITFFIGSLYGGGAERTVCNLASFLTQQGHEVRILTVSETERTYELDERVSRKALLGRNERRGRLMGALIRVLRFWSYIKKNKTDVYIVMLPKTTIMLLAFRREIKAKVIAAERCDPKAYGKLFSRMLKKYASRADGWVFQTDEARDWYAPYFKECKSAVIPNAINQAFIRPNYKGENRKCIAGVGRLSSQKNFSLLIKAFAEIASEFRDYDLIIYGKGELEKELKELAFAYGLQDRVVFPGNIQNIADEMEQNTLFVLSSDFEGMPNALIEAMALGLPCISTDCPCGGPRYLIKDGVNGVLIPVGNVKMLADAMRNMLLSPERAGAIGEEARKVTETLAPNKIYSQWEQFIGSIVDTNS